MLNKRESNMKSSEDEKAEANKKRPNSESEKDPKPKRIKNLYRQPTTAELNRLHETENLFNSNLFRLQINEIFEEVKVKEKTIKKFQTWFDKFKLYLLSIAKNDNEYDLSESTLRKELKVKIPTEEKLDSIKVAFKFHKFTDVSIVGSYQYDCAINSKLCVDIAIKIPAQTFSKNDSINYRFHKKCAYYLAIIASHLSKTDLITDLKYAVENCETKPFLSLKPDGKLGHNLSIKVRLVADENTFKLTRFSPNRNNLRESWLFSESDKENVGLQTPFYNSSILEDITHAFNQSHLKEVLENGENLKQAIILLKIWIRQRNLNVSGHIVCMLIAYLVHIRRINNIMSSYQIVRNVWIYVSASEWDKKGITLFKGESPENPTIEEFHATFPVVFLDRTGFYNICWKMQHGTYVALKRESTMAVKMLDNGQINSFIPLFMVAQKFHFQFDEIIRFRNTSSVKEVIYNRINSTDKLNYGLEISTLIVKKLYDILTKGLGSRCNLVLYSPKETEYSWGVKESYKKAIKNRNEEIRFGLSLNVEEALNTIEKGPAANFPEAESFRAFWGEKSELRRFQDGSITETCVWEGDTISDRRLVVRQIVMYLMQLKFGLNSDLFYISNQLDSVLTCKQYRPTEFEYGTGEEPTMKLLQAFDGLRKDLRNLTDLPLQINSVSGASPVFSYTDPLPPLPRASPSPTQHWFREKCCLIRDGRDEKTDQFDIKLPDFVKSSRAVIEFGHSGKWPGDIEAFRRLKAAFNLHIAESLATQCSIVTHAFTDHIAVVKDGYVFNLQISHPKEINLVRRYIEKGVVKYQDNEQSIAMNRDMVIVPKIRGALHGLHQSHLSFGPTVSLLKRWLSSHLIDDHHFSQTAIELLTAYTFLRPEPYQAAGTPIRGFQTVLHLLAHTDWTSQPIIINFNQQLKKEDITDLENKFSSDRSSYPPLVFATPYDLETRYIWAKDSPTDKILARVQILANSSLVYLERMLLAEGLDNVLGIFKPSYSGYDILIRLEPRYVPYRAESITERPKLNPLKPGEEYTHIPVVDFNPVHRYLNELRTAYSEFALFFHDTYGGDVIAVLWKPELDQEQEFQALKSNGTKPKFTKKEPKCTVNIEALIEDYRILGKGLVKEIVVC